VLDVNFFDELRIGLATADDIRRWSHGEVKKPETINYRMLVKSAHRQSDLL
jgi:DNA-directed RNA polymerase subunit beta'